MRYRIEISKSVEKFLDKHPLVRKRFFPCLEVLSLHGVNCALDIKKLAGRKN